MEVILDSSFIISAVKNKIDFISALEEKGFSIRIPKEVLIELKDLRLNVNHAERVAIDMGIEMLGKSNARKITLGKNKVDLGLISLGKQGAYIATLDNAIRRAVTNKIGLSVAKKSIIIERE